MVYLWPMGQKVATGFALIAAFAIGLVMLAEVYILQDTGEAATTGNLTTLFTLISPITLIVVSVVVMLGGIMGVAAIWHSAK